MQNLDQIKKSVYWDPYGLDNTYSGIYYYYLHLKSQLHSLGLDVDLVKSPGSSSFLKKIENLKVFASTRSFLSFKDKFNPETKNIYHGLSNINLPVFVNKPKNMKWIITIHDLIPFEHQAGTSKSYYLQLKFLMKRIIEKADAIVAVSNWTKNRIIKFYPAASEKLLVIENGIPKPQKLLKPKYEGLKLEFLYIARMETYKRVDFYCEMAGLDADCIFHLVTDEKGFRYVNQKYIKQIHQGLLKVYTKISEKQKKQLYLQCHCYVHPSLYEGFCLPLADTIMFNRPSIFSMGNAMEEYFSFEYGLPIDSSDRVLWLEKAKEIAAKFKNEENNNSFIELHNSRQNWETAALQYKNLYDKI